MFCVTDRTGQAGARHSSSHLGSCPLLQQGTVIQADLLPIHRTVCLGLTSHTQNCLRTVCLIQASDCALLDCMCLHSCLIFWLCLHSCLIFGCVSFVPHFFIVSNHASFFFIVSAFVPHFFFNCVSFVPHILVFLRKEVEENKWGMKWKWTVFEFFLTLLSYFISNILLYYTIYTQCLGEPLGGATSTFN